jgi:hypothetical protein
MRGDPIVALGYEEFFTKVTGNRGRENSRSKEEFSLSESSLSLFQAEPAQGASCSKIGGIRISGETQQTA